MNDPNHLPLAAAGIVGAAIGATARLLPDPIDVTFVPAAAALGYGSGAFVAILAAKNGRRGGEIGAAIGALVGCLIYLGALLGL